MDRAVDQHQNARTMFQADLENLEHQILEMGSLAQSMVTQAVDSLIHLDTEKALNVVRFDDEVDQRDYDIEAFCFRLLGMQNPIAGDLRVVETALKMITDLERMGDLAVDIAKAGLKIEKEFGSPSVVDVPKMSSVCVTMVSKALEAYVKRDLTLVEEVIQKDDEVDAMYRNLRGQIHDHMRRHSDAVVSDSWLLLAIHHLERVADHAVNIAERVHFMVTGKPQNLAKSHRPDASSP